MKLSKEFIEQFCKFMANGNTQFDSAIMCGVSEATIYNYNKWGEDIFNKLENGELVESDLTKNQILYLEFYHSFRKAKTTFKAYHINQIHKASSKTWQASAWLLERRYPQEWGRNDRLEVDNKGPQSVVNIDMSKMSEHELRSILNEDNENTTTTGSKK